MVNSRDAMPTGGDILIKIERICIDEKAVPPVSEMGRGNWIALVLSDNGEGIPEEILGRIMELFLPPRK